MLSLMCRCHLKNRILKLTTGLLCLKYGHMRNRISKLYYSCYILNKTQGIVDGSNMSSHLFVHFSPEGATDNGRPLHCSWMSSVVWWKRCGFWNWKRKTREKPFKFHRQKWMMDNWPKSLLCFECLDKRSLRINCMFMEFLFILGLICYFWSLLLNVYLCAITFVQFIFLGLIL